MGPVLALELSTEGILLHELSYDGRWREIATAGLNDPFLPKKMSAMRAAARASQGRMFRNEVWVPREQVILKQMTLKSDDPPEQQVEALQIARDDADIPSGNYIARVGEPNNDGTFPVALMEKSVLEEAIRFATGYGFGTDGITVPGKLPGFHERPYFDSTTIRKPIGINLWRYVRYLLAAGAVGGAVYGGWVLYNSIEFSPNPATVIQATDDRTYSEEEDPRAPIRPTHLATIPSQPSPELGASDTAVETSTNVDNNIDTLFAQVAGDPLSSSLDIEDAPEPASAIEPIDLWQEAPLQASESRPDSLPAPESTGFETATPLLASLDSSSNNAGLSLSMRDTAYEAGDPVAVLSTSNASPDALPREESTVVLAALERKLNDGFGLTQVQENDATALRMERIADFQNVAPSVLTGRPDILPILRSGADVTDVIDVPVVASAEPTISTTPQFGPSSIFELQRVAANVETGRPDIEPILRGGVEIGDAPPPPPMSIEELQNLAAVVEQGQPDITPPLRGGVEIGAEPPAPPLSIAELQTLAPDVVEGEPPFLPELRPEDIAEAAETDPTSAPDEEQPVEATELAALEPAEELSLEELQNLAPEIVQGQPELVPTLRDGEEISVSTSSPEADLPELTIEELQNLDAVVEEGRPDVEPILRDGEDITGPPPRVLTLEEYQNVAAIVEDGRPPILPTLRSGDSVDAVILSPEEELALIADLQAEPPLVLDGRPPITPVLREDLDLGEGSGVIAPEIVLPDQTEAALLRPEFRPESIEEIARVNDPDLSEVVVVSATAPPRRPADFASKVENMVQEFVQVPAAEPRFDDSPREVSLPTSASVAAAATIEDAISLRTTNLIGVYGAPGAYRALIRQPGGRYVMVSIGESIGDGWRVVGIDESSIRVQKGSRTETLGLPG